MNDVRKKSIYSCHIITIEINVKTQKKIFWSRFFGEAKKAWTQKLGYKSLDTKAWLFIPFRIPSKDFFYKYLFSYQEIACSMTHCLAAPMLNGFQNTIYRIIAFGIYFGICISDRFKEMGITCTQSRKSFIISQCFRLFVRVAKNIPCIFSFYPINSKVLINLAEKSMPII